MRRTSLQSQPGAKRTCKNRACRNKFVPTEAHPFAVACCTGCEIILAKQHIAKVVAAREKKERKELKERKEAAKTRSDHMREAQVAFNAFIRARDINQLCISSGRPLKAEAIGGGFDAGHYRSIGSAPHLRFDERNVHGQSKHDNRYLAGNAVDYRIGLIARIGLQAVEELEADQTPRRYTIDELKAIKATYKAKMRELSK